MLHSLRLYLRKKIKIISIWYLERYGYSVINARYLYPWQRFISFDSSYNKESYLPKNAFEYLKRSNPRLKELNQDYLNFTQKKSEKDLWLDGYVKDEHLLYFRGDNPYVWQKRGFDLNIMAYAMTYFWIKNNDKNNFLYNCIEDNSFGVQAFNFDGNIISRDLLDSINEIKFLTKYVFLKENKKINILDIGSGYGRLAHRMSEAVPSVDNYYCTDGIAESTFISEYYIKYRNLGKRVTVIPLHEFETIIEDLTLDLVINIHSFSEMNISFIKYWIGQISKKKIKYLFIVPNARDNKGNKLISYDEKDFQLLIEQSGYKLVVKKPKYSEPVIQQYGISPTYYYLFKFINKC